MDSTFPARLPLARLAREFGTPQFILSEARLLENLQAFVRFTGSPERVFFPVKANPALAVLQTLARAGCGADCSSAHEIQLATLAGIPAERMLYTSPVTDLELAERLLKRGAGVVIDNAADLKELEARWLDLPPPPGRILVRVNPDFPIRYGKKADYQDLTAHAAESSKFGIPVEELADACTGLRLPITGLHLHVGTQMDRLEPFISAIQNLHLWAESLRKLGHPVRLLDLGGGLGIPFGPEDEFPTAREFADAIGPLKDETRFEYAVEPGHALVGDAVALLTTIRKIKPSRGRNWAVVDVGTDQLAKITLLRWTHRIFTERGELPWTGKDAVAGPLCFGGDVLLPATDLGGLATGDPLVVATTGAYCGSLSNRFNGRLAPGMIVQTRDGRHYLAQEPENGLLDPGIQSFLWNAGELSGAEKASSSEQENPQQLAAEFYRLGSPYLWHLAAADQYKILEVRTPAHGVFDLSILTRSAVNFVSAPFALRLLGDAAIMCALRSHGATEKSAPVWGRTILMECRDRIDSGKTLDCRISISPAEDAAGNKNRRLWARCELDQGKFMANLELILE